MRSQQLWHTAHPHKDLSQRARAAARLLFAALLALGIQALHPRAVQAAPPLAFGFPSDARGISDDWAAHRARGSRGGTDYTAGYGSNLYAMADGVVTIANTAPSGGTGRYVRVDHGAMGPYGSVQTESLHLSVLYVSVGTYVRRGQVIGKTGASAYNSDYGTNGPHVHVHGFFNGTISDLQPYISSTVPTASQGIVHQIYGTTTSGWVSGDTGVRVSAHAFSVVKMGGTWPQIMVNENGTLHQMWGDTAGWHLGNTGLYIGNAQVSAVNMGGVWPQAMINAGGVLYQAWGDGAGWHLGDTGLRIGGGQISAVNMGGTWPQVMINIDGRLYQAWGDRAGWHLGDTGLRIGGAQISAVNMGGTWPQVMVNAGGVLYQAWGDTAGWHLGDTGLRIGGAQISAVNMGGTWPQVMVNIGGALHQAWGDGAGWHLGDTALRIGDGPVSAVNMGGTWPQVIAVRR